MPNDLPTQNLGLLNTDLRPKDWLAGTIPYEEVLPSGDWRPYLPEGENQYSQVADSQGCVSFSNNNLAEISLKQQGFIVNFSDRFLAKISNTQPNGNTFGIVQDAARNRGRVLESVYPTPTNFTWDSFYQPIPIEILNQAVVFDGYNGKEASEFLATDIFTLKHHLKHSPIQIAIPLPHPNHAVVLVAIEGTTAFYFDSYPGSTNYLKTLPVEQISAAMKLIIKPVNMTKYFKVNDHGKLGIMILEGFSGTILFENDFAEYNKLLEITGINDATPIINIP